MQGNKDILNVRDAASAFVVPTLSARDILNPRGFFTFRNSGPLEHLRSEGVAIRNALLNSGMFAEVEAISAGTTPAERLMSLESLWGPEWKWATKSETLARELARIPTEEKWTDIIHNTVTTEGKNDLLNQYLSGTAYTAAFYMGLISNLSYTAIVAGDTGAQINGTNGWLEAGVANAPTYSQATRPAPLFGAAAAGVKATSAFVVFSMTSAGTVKGSFIETNSTKDGAGGVLFAAGLFTQGDRVVLDLDTLHGTYSLTA